MSDDPAAPPEFAVDPAVARARRTVKWQGLPEGVLAAWVAETDFAPAAEIRVALHEAVERGDLGYPPMERDTDVPAATAGWLERAYGWHVEPGRVHTVADVLNGVRLAITHLTRPDSPVVLPSPAYPPFFDVIAAAGRPVVPVPGRIDGGRSVLDLAGIDGALAAGAGSVILCHPNNPLGRSYSTAELAALTEVVDRHAARVIADEVHAPLTYPGTRHVPYAATSGTAATHTVTVTSASKGWNLPGLKCAQVIITADADERVWRALPFLATVGTSPLGIAANVAAYRAGGPWLDRLVAHLDTNRRLLAGLVAAHLPGVVYRVPEATYLAWLDCRGTGLANPAEVFLVRGRVKLSDGAGFGEAGRGHVRLNMGTSPELLTEMVARMGAVLAAR